STISVPSRGCATSPGSGTPTPCWSPGAVEPSLATAAIDRVGPHPVMIGRPDDAALTDRLLAPLRRAPRGWWVLLALAALGTLVFVGAAGYTVARGIGVWGNN